MERRIETINRLLLPLSFAGIMAVLYLTFEWVPVERSEGLVQRIFYIHVPISWTAFLAFFVVFVASIMYLWKREERWDWLAVSAAELGLLMTSLSLITGSIWGRPTWGVWWTWDPRLTSTLLLWMIYVAYMMARAYTSEPGRGSRFAAVIGILGFADVPIVYFSVVWWQNIHPQPLIKPGDLELTGRMTATLFVSLLAFTMLFASLLIRRYLLQALSSELASIRRKLREEEEDARLANVRIGRAEEGRQ